MNKKKSVKIDNFRKWLGYTFILFFILFFSKIAIGNLLLKSQGICTKSILTNELSKIRGHKPTLVYNFWLNGKRYDGNSNIEELNKVGDSICVVYLKWMPSINRPISFFEKPINCNCK
ncbi:hypothetical protein [Flavobacterium daemonense]|uniref:hypothetical protein n=1 Tax=Flavobacterium daemonense TaxID=1393049 RepID=UPI00118537E6|nr:hypothetical protein [Flavobacterium daemonense]KAF2327389.1 hypothetical protein FND99_18790 [Flavobacterium daemonense]